MRVDSIETLHIGSLESDSPSKGDALIITCPLDGVWVSSRVKFITLGSVTESRDTVARNALTGPEEGKITEK